MYKAYRLHINNRKQQNKLLINFPILIPIIHKKFKFPLRGRFNSDKKFRYPSKVLGATVIII